MLNRAPYNTEVPQFLPSRDAPINSYITRKYPCQEHLANETNKFGTLTWKIQQPDPTMVWQSVKVVLPMEIQGVHKTKDAPANAALNNMNVIGASPSCNIALSQSPMNAFRQTSLTLNGRIFSEENYYRDILDTCYRGVGTQAYGDNHSLKPIVNRGIHSGQDSERVKVQAYNAATDTYTDLNHNGNPMYARTENLALQTVPSVNTLLEHNGPFIERARIFQDNLTFDGKTWRGEISHLLELGPFQARARKGNTAVPYIQDFHLRLNFANMPSKFDVDNETMRTADPLMQSGFKGRVMAPKLLEFATYANFLHKGEVIRNYIGWPAGFTFTYTAQPYLEVTYTKHESGMRDSYNLRCFEHIYEKSNRFKLQAHTESLVSPFQLARVTSRLLSNPTKIYVWAETSDEYKYTYGMGGVRRSCRLKNLHLRVNQRPDVMFNPSQEECYEMFRRHTNSSLEYGSWRKSPIYCFNMVDVGQPDMYANDARITWFEWDAEVQLTELQMTEQINLQAPDKLEAIAYNADNQETGDFSLIDGMLGNGYLYGCFDYVRVHDIANTDHHLRLTLFNKRGDSMNRATRKADLDLLKHQRLRVEDSQTGHITGADVRLGSLRNASQSIMGCIWAQVCTVTGAQNTKGDIIGNEMFYIPESFRFVYDDDSKKVLNDMSRLTFGNKIKFTDDNLDLIHFVQGRIKYSYGEGGLVNGQVGKNTAGCVKWAPGVAGYSITGAGIDNSAVVEYAALPKCDEKATNASLWVCFGPVDNMPTDNQGHSTWMRWLHTKTALEIATDGGLANWRPQTQHAKPFWDNGIEAMHGRYDCHWGVIDHETFNNVDTESTGGVLGGQLVWMSGIVEDSSRQEDFQLKVLYEYGNCQYNFSRSAAPTRVLPNVVPVGPSPGIPSL